MMIFNKIALESPHSDFRKYLEYHLVMKSVSSMDSHSVEDWFNDL